MLINVNSNPVTLTHRGSAQQSPEPRAVALPGQGNRTPETGKPVPQQPKIDIEKLIEQINEFISSNSRNLRFRYDDVTNRAVITVVSADSGEIIRQIPTEEVLRLAALMQDFVFSVGALKLGGIGLVDEQA